MTKQEYIQQAYGEYWDKVKDKVHQYNDFYVPIKDLPCKLKELNFEWSVRNITCLPIEIRPTSLKGIENNNGWISINNTTYPKPSDFLNETRVLCYKKGVKEVTCETFNEYWKLQRDFGRFTHYQLIEKPKPPLYD